MTQSRLEWEGERQYNHIKPLAWMRSNVPAPAIHAIRRKQGIASVIVHG